ncbi:MAG: hypothetical protein KDK44_04460, partial [Chlamydiia bacterium]|nr:hypothetical protein [Chlamydiia bacterium]
MSEKAFQAGCDFEAGKEIDFEAFTSCTKPCWGHFHFYHNGTADYLRNKSGVDEFVVDAMLAEETRPRFVEVNGSGCLVILRAINFHPDKENEDMVSVRLWIEPKRIISVVKQDFRSADEVKDLILRGVGPKTVGEFMVVLIKHILGHMEPVIAELDERTVSWEEEIPENAEHDLFSHLSETKKQTLILRRHLAPDRDVIYQLRHTPLEFFSKNEKRQIQKLHDRITLYFE